MRESDLNSACVTGLLDLDLARILGTCWALRRDADELKARASKQTAGVFYTNPVPVFIKIIYDSAIGSFGPHGRRRFCQELLGRRCSSGFFNYTSSTQFSLFGRAKIIIPMSR